MTGVRMHGLGALLRELFVQGGVHVFTADPAGGSRSGSPAPGARTMITAHGDVVVTVSRGVQPDGPLWAAHLEAVRSSLAPLVALKAWMRTTEEWIVRGAMILAVISAAAAIADTDGGWLQRLLRIGIPALTAWLIQRYRRRVVVYLAGVLVRRLLSASRQE
jgi:hypothetical protein